MILQEKLYLEALEDILSKNKSLDSDVVMGGFADFFYKKTVTKVDQNLISLAFNPKLDQTQLDAFLKEWDIECAGSAKSLLLAYVMKMHPDLKFNAYTAPRLRGLLNFFRFKNLNLISHYTKIGTALNRHGIVPMILKGGAMKYLRPDLPRSMGDIDILIKTPKEYQLAQKIVKEMGYELEDNHHSVDLHLANSEEGILDIHQYIEMGSEFEKEILPDLFKRAKKKKVFGVDTYVPCPEDMVFICLVNMVKNLREKTSLNGILYNLFDLDFFLTSSFNWDIVCQNILKTKTSPQVYIAYKFINQAQPDFMPTTLVQNKNLKTEITTYCNRDVFYYLYVYPIKCLCKKLKTYDEKKDWAYYNTYIKAKIKRTFLKFVVKHPCLVKFFLKRWYRTTD